MMNNILMIFGCFALHLALHSIHTERVIEPSSSKGAALLEGWKLLFQNPSLRTVTCMDLIETFAGTIWIGAITMAYVTTILHKGEEWWGYINTSYYVGTLIGGILAWKMSTYIQNNLIRSMAIGSLMFSILTFLYGMTSSGFIALFLCVLMGPCYQIRDISQTTVLQSSVPLLYYQKCIQLMVHSSRQLLVFLCLALELLPTCSVFVRFIFSLLSLYCALLVYHLTYLNMIRQSKKIFHFN